MNILWILWGVILVLVLVNVLLGIGFIIVEKRTDEVRTQLQDTFSYAVDVRAEITSLEQRLSRSQ